MSCLVTDPNQTVMDEQKTDWIIAAALEAQKVHPLLGLLDGRVYMLDIHFRSLEIVHSRNLKVAFLIRIQ